MPNTLKITVEMKDLAPWLEKLGDRVKPAVHKGFLSAGLRLIPFLQKRTREARPASPHGSIGAVSSGFYLRAWKSVPTGDGVRIYNSAKYAGIIEDGRRAGARLPPVGAIERWAMRKLHLSEEQAKKAAWPIRKAISKRGLKARKVMTGDVKGMTKVVHEEVVRELKHAIQHGKE